MGGQVQTYNFAISRFISLRDFLVAKFAAAAAKLFLLKANKLAGVWNDREQEEIRVKHDAILVVCIHFVKQISVGVIKN
jgi:hypothetical protein